METVLANLSAGKPRRERLHGRDWLVASAALIVPDRVLNGSNGPGWYPAEECARNPSVWNSVPLVLWHPTNERGEHVSARHPSVLEGSCLGTVYSTSVTGGEAGKLVSEAWFDVQLVKNADEKHKGRAGFPLLPRIEAGQPIELSTGLEPRYDRTKGVTNDGVAYDWIARDFRPDHVAVLPDMKGACSVADGCGINVNEEQGSEEHRCELCEGKPESEHCDQCRAERAVANLLNAGKYGNPQSTATGKFKWMGAGTGKGEAHDAAQRGFMNVSDAQRERAQVAAAEALQGTNPPSWAADEAKWGRAKQIVEEKMPDCEDWYACAAYVYDHMGGVVNSTEGITVNSGEQDMPLTKKEAVTYLTANCDCWKGQEAVLNAMSDEQLAKHYQHVQSEVKHRKEHEAVVNQLRSGVKLGTGGAALVLNSAGKMVVRNAVHGEAECDPEDKECLAMMEGKKKDEPVGNQQTVNADAVAKQVEAGIAKSLGFDSIDHARAVLNSAKQVNEEAKHRIVTRLVANVADDAKRNQLGNSLMKKDLAELKELALLAPPEQPVQPTERPTYNFAPAASGFGGTPILFNGGEDEELLDLPVMNAEAWAGKAKATA